MAWNSHNLLPIIIEMARGRKLTRRARRGTRKGSRKGTRRQRGGQRLTPQQKASLAKIDSAEKAANAAATKKVNVYLTRIAGSPLDLTTGVKTDSDLVKATASDNDTITFSIDPSLGKLNNWNVKGYVSGSSTWQLINPADPAQARVINQGNTSLMLYDAATGVAIRKVSSTRSLSAKDIALSAPVVPAVPGKNDRVATPKDVSNIKLSGIGGTSNFPSTSSGDPANNNSNILLVLTFV